VYRLTPVIFINHLPEGLESPEKNFADDTSLFSLVLDQIQSNSILTLPSKQLEFIFQKGKPR